MTAKKTTGRSKKAVERHEKNPFTEDMVVPVRNQRVKLSRLGQEKNVDVINHDTGEHYGTHVTAYRKVDSAQFVKLFTQNIALTFDLKSSGIKALSVLIWVLQERAVERDLIPLDRLVLEDFIDAHGDREPPLRLSPATFFRGLAELEKAQIIAKHLRQGWYYINPNFVFNGDRIAFTTVIERQKAGDEKQNELEFDQ